MATKQQPIFDDKVKNGIIYKSQIGSGMITYDSPFDATNLLEVPVCGENDFNTHTIALIMEQNSWVILGETSKLIRVSEQCMVYSKEGSVIMQL